jgi:predicted HD superfamily hydrolase involved in NAD metabolism
MIYTDTIDKLRSRLSPKRFQHSQGVSQTAEKLAERYGADPGKALLAGILHDCAREIPSNNLLHTAQAFGIVVSDIERLEPVLLHARLGARIAQTEYGINDPEILQAITLHTTGGPEMSLLDKIIFLADYIEPGRDFPGVDKLRSVAELDLDRAVIAAYDQTIRYLVSQQGLMHPATIEGRNALLIKMRI